MVGLIIVIISGAVSALIPYDALPESLAVPFREGGWGMRLILFSLFVSVWLTIDRTVVMIRASFDARAFTEQLRAMIEGGNLSGAIEYCRQTNKPLSRIAAAALAKAAEGEERVLKAMDETAFGEVPLIEKRTGYLALMGNVATLMGLFGTIIGLIHSFGAVGAAQNVGDKATQLAAGISEAMNCTAFGLFTGIFALVAFSVLNGKTQRLIDEINHLSLRIYRSWKRSKGADPTAPRPIVTPGPHLMTNAGLNAGGGGGRPKKSTFASLQLTPLIDMFIVLVIFLLISFSATGDLGVTSKDIKPPFAEQVDDLKRSLIVAISYPEGDPNGGVVTLENHPVATARETGRSRIPTRASPAS
jgi:biopolymer transport protein ExbB/TolQ